MAGDADLRGAGRRASLQAHGYQARESLEHTLYEMIAWFDHYVKNAPAADRTGGRHVQPTDR